MEKITRWTRERAQLRRVFTRHQGMAETTIDFEFLAEKVEAMRQLDTCIQQEMLNAEEYNDEAFSKECDEADEYRKRWLLLKKNRREAKEVSTVHHDSEGNKHKINLPKLEIRKFDDNPKTWLSFWGQYKKIHEDTRMDAETKFQYLTQAMVADSKARSLVESYPPTEENYEKVIHTLKERFAKDEILIELYVRELLKLVTNRNSLELDTLYDKITTNLQILESLGIAKDKYECILLPMIESALPEGTLLLWSKTPIRGEGSKLSRLLGFLQTEVEAERRVQIAKCEFTTESKQESPATAACLVNETKVKDKQSDKTNGNKREKRVRALLDSGSQRTYVGTALAEELGLQVTGKECLSHSLFGGVKKAPQTHRTFKFRVSNLDNTFTTTMSGLEQEVLCGNIPKIQNKELISKLQQQKILLSDAQAKDINEVEILIGSDQLGSILENNIVSITDTLVAVKTKLGWTLQGPIQSGVHSNVVHVGFTTTIPEMEDSIEFLWNLETLGIKDPYNKEIYDTCLDISVNKDGRYEVPLLWKEGYPKIESNYEAARKRLHSTTMKLANTGRLEDYHNIFKEWENEGIIELVDRNNEHNGHYLPHHAVIKLESSTTKIRPVMDASSKDKNGLSLNMCIEKGVNLIEMIPKLIIRFRAGMYGLISDIKKAFLQISVSPQDRKYLKLLWWKDPNKKDELITYQHARVPFGVACSPYLLAATISHHLEQNTQTCPETAIRLKESFYVDNCVTSFDTKPEAMKFIEEATELMNNGKFELRGWITNSEQEEEPVSVLGIQWDRKEDKLKCNFNLKTVPKNITKRELLSVAQQIFDPIGYLSPVSLIPKLIIQKAWLMKTGWNENIAEELEKEYREWIQTIEYLRECKIPRSLSEFPLQKCQTSVHVFCDASKDAYAGCVYLRTEHHGQVTVRLILAKTRVAPVKRQNLTLPRLELMGALIASRLYLEVVTSGLLSACKDYKVHCWTDSAIVLAWVQRQETWKSFVTNRVREICTNTNKDDWNHLPGVYNIADLPSRGCNSKTLLETQWWRGPQWLYLKEENWPKSEINYTTREEEIINSEQSRNTTVNVEIATEDFNNSLLYFNQYNKIVRLVARLLRLSHRLRKIYNMSSENISYEEYKHAEEVLIKLIQRESFLDKKKLNKKLITIEERGILKIKTRIQYSGEEKDFIYPILLPGNNEIVRRMVQEVHKKMNHAGTQTLMATLRNTYWITGVRKVVKNIVSKCIICKRYKAKHYVVPEPPLPEDRIKAAAPFEVTGLDLAGPLFLKNNQKCWIILYTCAVYRCVFLDLCESLSTNSLLMSIRRFIARRGRPRIIYSDNGTNMVGASNLLREVQWREIEDATSFYKITWKFSVPLAPWWGGWWERLIRVVKDMLRRVLGKASVDWIELSTILCDCEAVINSRPLTYVEMGEIKPLTPMSFLQSLPSNETPDLDKIDEKNVQVRYKYLQQLREDFRKRFKNEYLSLLISKGKENKNEPRVGELVLIETDKGRLHWPVGIIREIFTGKDGFTRAARVLTASGEKVRPYQRLYPLELSTVSQEWLDTAPVSTVPDTSQEPVPVNTLPDSPSQESDTSTQSSSAPVALVPTTRSGRAIKLPHSKRHNIDPDEKALVYDPAVWGYDMSGDKLLVILHHHTFKKTRSFKNRQPVTRAGTDTDVRNLKSLFEDLGFKVKDHKDLVYDNIIDTLTEVASRNHTRTSCICIAILTHADEVGVLYAANRQYSLSEILTIFEKRPQLVMKPKLFLIQASKVKFMEDNQEAVHRDGEVKITVSTHTDFLILHSSVEDYVEEEEKNGSWMIKALYRIITKYRTKLDLLQMITLMNREVVITPSDEEKRNQKQMPETTFTLTKQLKF